MPKYPQESPWHLLVAKLDILDIRDNERDRGRIAERIRGKAVLCESNTV